MGHILVILALVAFALASIAYPWVGVICGYLLSVLQPQSIWFWDFGGLRPELLVLLPTGVGFIVGIVRGKVKLEGLWNRLNLYLLILWLFSAVSYYLGPYTQVGGPYRFDDPVYRFSELNKMFLLYFVACACIDDERKLKALFYVMVVSGVYLTYWANVQYLTGQFFGRLNGPTSPDGGGVYADQNSFAAFFVVALPFIWYLGGSFRRPWWRWACWLIVPFCWNAMFLTGSRGGLLGLGATIALIALRSQRKLVALALIPAFIFVFVWQGGSVMKNRADTIMNYQQSGSAEDRFESWHAALRMIRDHPLTGVGLASYGPAFPHYSDKQPREAHDTFLQITAESGVVAGAMYLLIVFGSLVSLWKNGKRIRRERRGNVDAFYFAASEAALVGWLGLVVCSLFLSLQDLEVFYYLALMTNVVVGLERKEVEPESVRPGERLEFARASRVRSRI